MMTENEINKTIAEYIGIDKFGCGMRSCEGRIDCEPNYTTSLDSCVPVVEKLMLTGRVACGYSKVLNGYRTISYVPIIEEAGKMTRFLVEHEKREPALALATALAKVIKEIEK